MSAWFKVFAFMVLIGGISCLNMAKWVRDFDKRTDYNKLVPPLYDKNMTTKVKIQLYMETMGNFRPQTMDFDADIYLIENWHDPRLAHDHDTYVSINDRAMIQRLWLPDVYFANSKKGSVNNIVVPNVALKIFNNGTVRYSLRLSLKLTCVMNLKAYPLDKQICCIRLLTYQTVMHQVRVSWLKETSVVLNPEILESDFAIDRDQVRSAYCNGTKFAGRKEGVSCLTACLYLKRFIGYSCIRTYIPSIIVVAVSWISFWLEPDSVPGRVALCMSTLLVQATRAISSQFNLPPVGYVKAQDVWFGICVLFHFAALIEFAAVNMYSRMDKEELQRAKRDEERALLEQSGDATNENEAEIGTRSKPPVDYRRWALKIDRIARLAFPITFTALFIIYFCYYLTLSPKYVY